MKKILSLLLIFVLIIFTIGCGNESIKTATTQTEKIGTETEKNKKTDNKKDIEDIDAIVDFVSTTDTNLMMDQHENKLIVLENYETHYLDFTGEGNDDIAIVTWDDNNEYLPVIFVTTDIVDNDYYLINSDFRASAEDEFFCEDGFIIKEDKKNKSYDIACNIENELIQMSTRYISYGDITQIVQPEINTKYISNYTLEKLDGFNKFNVNMINTYYDEKGIGHKYEDITYLHTFNEETHEFDVEETQNMETIPLETLISENFITGTNNSLKTFKTVYDETDLETAINYYYDNRQNFNKDSRIKYIDDYSQLTSNILYPDNYSNYPIYGTDEVIANDVISSVSVYIDMIPKKMNSVFSVVKRFYLEDGANPPTHIDEDGDYCITCIKSDITNKINLMSYDRDILSDNPEYYGSENDDFVDVEFQNQEQMLEDINDIVYPTVLINKLSQLDKFKHKDIWKTQIVIIPKEINFVNIDDIQGFEDI